MYRFTAENFGIIARAEINLEHDLTILVGPNNTGKSYISHCLYAIHSGMYFSLSEDTFLKRLPPDLLNLPAMIAADHVTLEHPDLFELLTPETLASCYQQFSSQLHAALPDLLGVWDVEFPDTRFTLERTWDDRLRAEIIKQRTSIGTFSFNPESNENRWQLTKQSDDRCLTLTSDMTAQNLMMHGESTGYAGIGRILSLAFVELFFYRKVWMIPAERTIYAVFNPNQLAGLQKLHGQELLILPQSLLRLASWFSGLAYRTGQPRNAAFREEIAFMAAELLGGQIHLQPQGGWSFSPDLEGESVEIPSRLTGSGIKGLSPLYFFLQFHAQPGSVLVIDEPEMNLHPDRQRMMARLLARCVNKGLKVVVSTHSDYLLRELENLLVLAKGQEINDPELESELRDLKSRYGYDDSEILDPAQTDIGVYHFIPQKHGRVEVQPRTVSGELGFDVDTINREIDHLADATMEIYDLLYPQTP